jgi:hypothetical protein
MSRIQHWWHDFIKPINMTFLVLGVAGLLFGWYEYKEAVPNPQLAMNTTTQIVWDYTSANPELTVLDKAGQKVDGDIYASQITVWNSGNVRLDNVDESTIIRKPLTFFLQGTGRILSASITKSLQSAGDWSVDSSPALATMHWRHFDLGAAVQVLLL